VVSVRDPSSLRTGVTTSLGLDLRILRDPMGDVSELRDSNGPILRYERAANGIALQRQLAQGGAVVDSYDGAWRLARRQVVTRGARVVGEAEPEWIGGAPPGTIYKTYGYSPADEVVAVTTVADGTTELEYDVRRHLLKKRASQGDETWAADPVGNYYERGATAASRSYLPGSRIAAKGSTEYAWDDRGFLTAKVRRHDNAPAERWIYHWNGLDLLSAVELPDGRSVAFEYDVYARRVEKRVTRYRQDGASDVLSTTHYVWDGSSLVHDVEVKKGEAAAARRTYLFEETDDATPIAQRDAAGAWAYYVGDVNGTPDEIIDGAGRLLGSLRRSTFGEASPTPGSQTTTPFRAPGQLADEETGLHYNRYRYYDPEIGHYISPDPIGIDGGTNLYTFGPNPIGWYDLLGWQHKMTASLTGADNQPINIPWNGNQDVSGSYLSGQRPEPDLQSANPRRDSNVHTEKQFLRDLDAYNKPKGKLDNTTATLNGQYPPCPQCHKAMRKFAKENNMKIQYTYTGPNGKPQTITYDHGSPPSGTGEGGFAAARVGPTGSGNNAEYRAQRDALMAQGVTTPPNWKRPPQ
jgi:RHS repeat-associated protein